MPDAHARFTNFKTFIAANGLPALGPERRAGTMNISEVKVAVDSFCAAEGTPEGAGPLLQSAALLWHDHLDASHELSQSIESRNGSWLHGIVHRREPDYGNAKYWFRRVGQHDAFPALAERVAALLEGQPELATSLIENGEWMPFAFIDQCERAAQRNDTVFTSILQRIQAAEFDTLVQHILSRP
jgi:hypothetical protein